MREPTFLSVEQVLAIHAMQLHELGGQDGVRDRGALESAIAQAEAGFGDQYLRAYPFGMAAAYAFHIAGNQPFIDGNKRTALNAAITFLGLNDVVLECPGTELFQAMIDIGNHRLDKAGLSEIFKRFAKP